MYSKRPSILIAVLVSAATCVPLEHGTKLSERQSYSWNGWENIQYVFSFGDSYTTDGFDPSMAQPSESNPIGNPPYPGMTEVGTPTYTEYLTTTYNDTFTELYDLGNGGATIDVNIDPNPLGSIVRTFRQQVDELFLPYYGNSSHFWTATNTLFTIFFGINDVILVNGDANASDYTTALTNSYIELVTDIYNTGARNFLFINVPPIDRTPGRDASDEASREHAAAYIQSFNTALGNSIDIFSANHSDTTIFQFDIFTLFNNVLDNPSSYEISSVIKNTTDSCDAYAFTTDTSDFNATCGIPLSEYFWADGLHVTFTVNDLIGQQIAAQLRSRP